MTGYDREINKQIINELIAKGRSTCTQIHKSLKEILEASLDKKDDKKRGYTTLWEHLDKLSSPEIGLVSRDDKAGPHNRIFYSLSPAAELRIEYDGIDDFMHDLDEMIETKREDAARRQQKETQQARKYEKILTRIILQAAIGTSHWRPAREPGTAGNVINAILRDPKTGNVVTVGEAELYPQYGVSEMDIVENREVTSGGLFSYVKSDRSDVRKYLDKLKSNSDSESKSKFDGLSDIIVTKRRFTKKQGSGSDNDDSGNGRDIGTEEEDYEFSIPNDYLRRLVRHYHDLLWSVKDRIEQTLKLAIVKSYKDNNFNFPRNSNNDSSFLFAKSVKREGEFIDKAFKWYVFLFGQEKFNVLCIETATDVIRHILLDDEETYFRLEKKAADEQQQLAADRQQLRSDDDNKLINYRMYCKRLYNMVISAVVEAPTIIVSSTTTPSTAKVAGLLKLKSKSKKMRMEMEMKKKYCNYIHGIEGRINFHDRRIVDIYHYRIKCDRYDKEGQEARMPEEYYEFVRSDKMPKELSRLVDMLLLDVVYPQFLRDEHEQHNQELINYVGNMPEVK